VTRSGIVQCLVRLSSSRAVPAPILSPPGQQTKADGDEANIVHSCAADTAIRPHCAVFGRCESFIGHAVLKRIDCGKDDLTDL
jgi:hypothetical protein